MKFTLTFKTPDVLYPVLHDIDKSEDYTEDTKELLVDAVEKTSEKFLSYGEIISIEFDTQFKTATVLNVK